MKKRLVHLVLVCCLYEFYRSFCCNVPISGFYSLFSVTEEPFVSSGGKFDVIHNSLGDLFIFSCRAVDGFLLEG